MVIWISDSIAHTCSHLAANPLAHPKFHRNEGGFDPHPNFETIKPLGRTERFYWCSILELVRTHFVACGGEEVPPRKFGKAAEPHRSKPQKNPEKNIGSNHILRNREFVFTPKIEYKLIADRSEANQNSLTFPFWCAGWGSNPRPRD